MAFILVLHLGAFLAAGKGRKVLLAILAAPQTFLLCLPGSTKGEKFAKLLPVSPLFPPFGFSPTIKNGSLMIFVLGVLVKLRHKIVILSRKLLLKIHLQPAPFFVNYKCRIKF